MAGDGSDIGEEEKQVEIRVSVTAGSFVRQIGSDIAVGEEILPAGHLIRAAEIGLLATAGVIEVGRLHSLHDKCRITFFV